MKFYFSAYMQGFIAVLDMASQLNFFMGFEHLNLVSFLVFGCFVIVDLRCHQAVSALKCSVQSQYVSQLQPVSGKYLREACDYPISPVANESPTDLSWLFHLFLTVNTNFFIKCFKYELII